MELHDKLKDNESTPPSGSWDTIKQSIASNNRIYNIEIPPPVEVWDKIQHQIKKKKSARIFQINSSSIIKYAAAIFIAAIFSLALFNQTFRKNIANSLRGVHLKTAIPGLVIKSDTTKSDSIHKINNTQNQ